MIFCQKLDDSVQKNNSLMCVGLDSDYEKIPEHLKQGEFSVYDFNKAIIDATADLVCAYKPNLAFYESYGAKGVKQLKMTCEYIAARHPEIVIIIDAKRADIADTNKAYARYVFDYLLGDAVTVHPYMGGESLAPFLTRKEKGCIVLCRTSNPGAGEFQDLLVNGEPLYKYVARRAAGKWNANGNCALMAGATYPTELGEIRGVAGEMPILIAGIGAQGGKLDEAMKAGLNSKGGGLIINASRSIIFDADGEDFALKARAKTEELKNLIHTYRLNIINSNL